MARSGLSIGLRMAQRGFFDRPKVQFAVDRTTARVFSRFGAFVRTRARSSIRKRKRISASGQPPSSHVGTLKKFIFFSFDTRRRSVVIGPVPIAGAGTAPETLEYGGRTSLFIKEKNERVTANYRPRPFMTPAFTEEQKTLPALWRDSVK